MADYTVLVVREVWHHKDLGRHIERGEVITNQAEVKQILAERPHHVIARMATQDEADEIEAAAAAHATDEPTTQAPAALGAPTPAAPTAAVNPAASSASTSAAPKP